MTILSEMGVNVSKLKNCCVSCIFILNHILSITVVFCHSFMVFTVKTKLKMLPVCSDEASVTDTALKLYSLLSFQEL